MILNMIWKHSINTYLVEHWAVQTAGPLTSERGRNFCSLWIQWKECNLTDLLNLVIPRKNDLFSPKSKFMEKNGAYPKFEEKTANLLKIDTSVIVPGI